MSAERGLVAEIKDRLDIRQTFELCGLDWPERGWKFAAPCHEDEHPSGHIYVSQNRWQCFVCDIGGDVIDLCQLVWGTDGPETIGRLAGHLRIDRGQVPQWVAVPRRQPSPSEMVGPVAAAAHSGVLVQLQADYPERKANPEAWCALVGAAFWHYDEILRRYRNQELSAEATHDLLLIWWKHMTGGGARPSDITKLFATIGDDRFWRAITEEGNREQAQGPGDQGRDQGREAAPGPGLRGRAHQGSGVERHRRRAGGPPQAGDVRGEREGPRAPVGASGAAPRGRSLRPGR